MTTEFNPHEIKLMEKMTRQHRSLMEKLSVKERKSLNQNVKKSEDIELIQSWIKSDNEIENILFWDKGEKYDDPDWQSLRPVDDINAELFEKANKQYLNLRNESVEIQRRSDLTLLSQAFLAL